MKEELIDKMKVLLSSVFVMYLKAHNYHWNVTGPNFIQYHDYFGGLYEQLHDSVDVYAEHIRALGSVSPGSLTRFSELSKIEDELNVPEPRNMFRKMYMDNSIIIDLLKDARNSAEENQEFGVVNFLEGQIDAHDKLGWMLKSFTE